MTKFSVLISIYYKENPNFFRLALDSVFSQSLLPSEIVLIEDGILTDELYEVITFYQNKYPIFKIIKNKINIGLGKSLAKGIIECSNEFIVRMDTDDIIPSTRFEKQLKKLEEGYDVVSSWSVLFQGSLDNVIAVKKRPEHNEDIIKLAHKRSPICHAGSAYKKSSVLKAGNYEHHLFTEDYDLWIRMILSGAKFYNIQEPLYFVRTSIEMASRRGGWKYLKTELENFYRFYKYGFYTISDLIKNSITHLPIRIMPLKIRSLILKKIWNHRSV